MREDLKKWKHNFWGEPRKGQSSERVPHYCKKAKEWRCTMDGYEGRKYEARGNIELVMSEFVCYNETYEYDVKEAPGEDDWCHGHNFESVLMALLLMPEYFSVEEYKHQYSQQQIELIKVVKDKLLSVRKKNTQPTTNGYVHDHNGFEVPVQTDISKLLESLAELEKNS